MKSIQKAFTLIELLVVIAIIAILAAILFPVFAQAKMAAKKAADLSNLKQQSTSSMLYMADNDDMSVAQGRDAGGWLYWFAGSGRPLGFMDPTEVQNWSRETMPYMKNLQIFINPAAPNDGDPNYGFSNFPGAGNGSYAANGIVLGISQTVYADPASTIYLVDKATTTREAIVQPTPLYPLGSPLIANGIDISWVGISFGSRSNYAFCDGHAKNMERRQVQFRNYGIAGLVRCYGPSCIDVPNTTGMSDPRTNTNFWQAYGEANPAGI